MPATDRRPTREDVESADPKAWSAGFARSRKGNLWRRMDDGFRLTVFPSDGGFAWLLCNDDDGTAERSPDTYRTERAAVEAAWSVLYGG